MHPIHISVCDIAYDKERKALEIVQRIFLDDLELAIRNSRDEPYLDILDPKNNTTDNLLKDYLNEHFQLKVNGAASAYSYLGHEIEGDAVYCYLELEKINELKSIGVFSSILTDEYDDQVNLVHVEVDDNIRSMKLTGGEKTDVLTY